jgi:hypothetical protein
MDKRALGGQIDVSRGHGPGCVGEGLVRDIVEQALTKEASLVAAVVMAREAVTERRCRGLVDLHARRATVGQEDCNHLSTASVPITFPW